MISNLLLVLAVTWPASNNVDDFVDAAAARDGITPTGQVGDDLFLRRISLDLLGRIPTLAELRDFRKNPDRSAAVDRMLDSSEHALFWSRIWTTTLIGFGQTQQTDREALRSWLEEEFAAERAFDQTVFDLISAEGRSAFNGPANFMLRHVRDPVVPIGRIFLGVQLDCARCHDHPFARWTQADFEGMERFFSVLQTRQPSQGNYELLDRRPSSDSPQPKFLSGLVPRTGKWRQELALFVTSSKPFARATANRLWYHFFGHGIANPPDAVNGSASKENLDLINYLAQRLRDEDFQLRDIKRELCLSRAYQRPLAAEHAEWPLHPTAKPMTPDQLFDSIHIALNKDKRERQRVEFTRATIGASLDEPLNNSWDSEERVQAMMTRLSFELPKVEIPVDELFERVLTRAPTPQQRELCQDQRLENVLFALINSNEFYFWH